MAKQAKPEAPKAHPDSLCADCIFFAGGTCPRALTAMEGHVEHISDLIVTGCGGYEAAPPTD